ncbi:MAG: ribose 5-phosphate isomerase B [Acidobacteria bacterium]|nr:ribose 5-phosphate isomerase B [Acidobacteriota bacterium]
MKIAIAADHGGFLLKDGLRDRLRAEGFEVADFGANSAESVDYPDYAAAVARAVAAGQYERGVLICTTGVGMSISANKVAGIRAALGTDDDEVSLTRRHNDANVLTLGARYVDLETAARLTRIFLETQFEGGRHARRVEKIAALDRAARD